MEAANGQHGEHGQPGATRRSLPAGHPLHAVPFVEARLEEELADQFQSAVAFADFCAFLTSHRVSDQAGQLVELAHLLYAETTADLQRTRPRA
jgi:hypothetical protein